MDEDLVVERAGEVAGRGELAEQNLEVVAGDAVGVDVGHEPSAAHRIVHHDIPTGLEAEDPVLIGALGALHGPLSCCGIGRALDADGQPGVVGEVREGPKQQRVDAAGKRAAERILVEGRRGGQHEGELCVAVHAGQHVVVVRHRGVQAPSGLASEGAGGVVHHALQAQAVSGGIRLVVEAGQSRRAAIGTRAVVAAAVVLGHGRVVVAGQGIQAPAEFVFIADAITVGVVEAGAVAIDVVGRRVGAGTVIDIGVRVEVAGRGIDTAPVEAGTVLDVRTGVVVDRRSIGTTVVLAGPVVHVGTGVIVRRRVISAAGVLAGPIVHVRIGIVVGGRGVRTTGVLAAAVVGVRRRVVVHRTAVEAAGEQARAIVRVGRDVIVDGIGIGTPREQAGPVVGVGPGVVVARCSIGTAFENAGPIVGVGRRIVVGRVGVGTAREQA